LIFAHILNRKSTSPLAQISLARGKFRLRVESYRYPHPYLPGTAWVAAEFRERELEGYDMSLPIFAIEIEGDMWNLYIGYASGSTADPLVFVAPRIDG
jgi:hypothetical protein